MNKASLSKSWVRFLEGRNVSETDHNELLEVIQENDSVGVQLLEDLDLHRQLNAMGHLTQDDFSFVGQTLVRFEEWSDTAEANVDCAELQHSGLNNSGFQDGESKDPEIENAESVAPLAPLVFETPDSAPTRITITKNPETNSTLRRHSKKNTQWIVLACVPLLIGLLIVTFQMGKHSGFAEQVVSPGDDQMGGAEKDKSEGEARDGLTKKGTGSGNQSNTAPSESQRDKEIAQLPNQLIPEKRDRLEGQPDDLLNDGPEIAAPKKQRPVELVGAEKTWAEVVDEKNAVWNLPPKTLPRIGARVMDLVSGVVVIELDSGEAISFEGPARLVVDQGFVELQEGNFIMDVPEQSDLTIQVRDSHLQPGPESQFVVKVDSDGASNLELEQGAIQLSPWYAASRQPVEMASEDGFQHLQIGVGKGEEPVAARMFGKDKFQGWVKFDGQLVKSTDKDLIDTVLTRASDRFQEAPSALQDEWNVFAGMVNPKQLDPDSPMADVERMQKEMMERMRQRMQDMMPGGLNFPDLQLENIPLENSPEGFSFSFDGDNLEINGKPAKEFQNDQQKKLGVFADLVEQFKN